MSPQNVEVIRQNLEAFNARHWERTGRDSDIAIDQPGATLHEMRNGKIFKAASYLSQDEALRDAGVES